MSRFREILGLDAVDLTIHVGVTSAVIGFVAMSGGPEEMFPVITGLSILVLGIRRSIALRATERRGLRSGLTTGEVAAERLTELEQRMAELDAVHARVAELEERLDFTERLLAKSSEHRPVGPGVSP